MQIGVSTSLAIIAFALSVLMFNYNRTAMVEYTHILTCETSFFFFFKAFCYSESERHVAAVRTGLCFYHLLCAFFFFLAALIALICCFTALSGNTLRRVVRTIRRHFHELLGRIFC